jgi:hypothetical protein
VEAPSLRVSGGMGEMVLAAALAASDTKTLMLTQIVFVIFFLPTTCQWLQPTQRQFFHQRKIGFCTKNRK